MSALIRSSRRVRIVQKRREVRIGGPINFGRLAQLVERCVYIANVGGSSPSASTEMENSASQEWRSPRPPQRRALQSPVYIPKKAADYLKSSPSRLFWRRIIILRHYVSRARFFCSATAEHYFKCPPPLT